MATIAGEHGETAADEQWTRIVRKGKGNNKKKLGRQAAPSPASLPPAAGPVENFQPNAAPKLSVADIQAEHEKLGPKWRASEGHARLMELIRANAASCAHVTRAICLGLGAFDPEDGSSVARRRSHVQLAAFLAMVEAMEEAAGERIDCFYQEPRFAQPDKDFIASLGGKVVESPASYALVDHRTMVFGVHLYRDIWAAALDKALPAVFVGTGWDVWDGTGSGSSLNFDRIREMDESTAFRTFSFPQDDDLGSFSSTCVYWKRREPEGEETEALEKAIASLDLEPDKDTETGSGKLS